MRMSDIRALSLEELKNQIKTERATGQTLRFAHAISPLENPSRLKQNRKTVARLLGELGRREKQQATQTAN